MIPNLSFDSLYSLVTHYQKSPLKSDKFEQVLTEPVPQPQSHESQEWVCSSVFLICINAYLLPNSWYHDTMTRAQAEDMLCRLTQDGAFLIRKRLVNLEHDPDPSQFAISFR
jgi:phosphatidylinositol phospholipase C gamma-1